MAPVFGEPTAIVVAVLTGIDVWEILCIVLQAIANSQEREREKE